MRDPGRADAVLLHLSDLHFGADDSARDINDRALCLDKLLESLTALPPEWQPGAIVVTGDIGWRGKDSDYREAARWLLRVSDVTGVLPSSFVFCPGNHDVDRAIAVSVPRPSTSSEANDVFKNGMPAFVCNSFAQYTAFCEAFGAPPLAFRGEGSRLCGTVTVADIRFIVINTAWFSKDSADRRQLRVGLPLVQQLDSDHSLIRSRQWGDRPLTVSLMHHPSTWLHDDETGYWGDAEQGAYLYLAARSHLVLSGHSHEVLPAHGRAPGGGIVLGCGATFANAGHPNQYQLIRFKADRIEYRRSQYDKHPLEQRWTSKDVDAALYSDRPASDHDPRTRPTLAELQERCARHARDYVLAKSKALTPGSAPEITPLLVSRTTTSTAQELAAMPQRLELRALLRETNRAIIWGDLGTGKSTLVGRLTEGSNRLPGTLAVLFVASNLALFLVDDGRPLSVDAISKCLRASLVQEAPTFDFATSAALADETILVVDGLDEVKPRIARRILAGLDVLPSSFPRLRVVATSRQVPDEYTLGQDWASVSMASLTEAERVEILRATATASGLEVPAAAQMAKDTYRQITADAVLDEIAVSPLALRLVFRQLTKGVAGDETSLAELLQGLLDERLHGWEHADAKQNPAELFCAAVPTVNGRAQLLSALAGVMDSSGGVEVRRALDCLQTHPVLVAQSGPVQEQALAFFQWTGLIVSSNDRIEFALRPLFEVARVPGVRALLAGTGEVDPDLWRVVAFAAALERKRNSIGPLKAGLVKHLKRCVERPFGIVPGCFVAADARDQGLAQIIIDALKERRFERPLYQFADQQRTSASAIARTISLAGDAGFEWFFSEYLDPRYPWINYGSRTPQDVFQAWVSIAAGAFSSRQRDLLGQIPGPHLEADSAAVHAIVPLAVLASPGSLSTSAQCDLLSSLLTHRTPAIESRAKERLRVLGARDRVAASAALLRHVIRGYENAARCAELWLELQPLERPPRTIVSAVLVARGNWNGRFFEDDLRARVRERLGEKVWRRFCRFELANEDQHIAVGAALEVVQSESSLATLLEEQLLGGLEDGGSVMEAEEVMASLCAASPENYSRRLATKIGAPRKVAWHGAPAAWWRLFLGNVRAVGKEGPVLLGRAVRGLREFTLVRDDEVRERIKELASGNDGPAYVEALGSALRLGTGATRRGAAQVLICMREHLVEALVASARASADLHNHSWEWDELCASMRFAPTVIDAILARTADLSPKARLFVLSVAVGNGRKLSDSDARTVIVEGRNSVAIRSMAASEDGVDILKSLFESAEEAHVAIAARYLLEHHRQRLDESEVLTGEIMEFERRDLPRDYIYTFRKLRDAVGWRDSISALGPEITARFGHPFTLVLLADAAAGRGSWRDLLWTLLCTQQRLPSDEELTGSAIIAIGNVYSEVRAAIGSAARELFDDSRLQTQEHLTFVARAWCALMAHEFGTLASDDVGRFLDENRARWHHVSVVPALLARVAPRPSGPVGGSRVLQGASSAGERPTVETLIDMLRDGPEIGPSTCEVLAESLYDDRTVEDLGRLAATGGRGRVCASALCFVYERLGELDWALKYLDGGLWAGGVDSRCARRIHQLARLAFRKAVEAESANSSRPSSGNGRRSGAGRPECGSGAERLRRAICRRGVCAGRSMLSQNSVPSSARRSRVLGGESR